MSWFRSISLGRSPDNKDADLLRSALVQVLRALQRRAPKAEHWRVEAVVESLETEAPGPALKHELAALIPRLTPVHEDASLDTADAFRALLGAMEATAVPELRGRVSLMRELLPRAVHSKEARQVARAARSFRREASETAALSEANHHQRDALGAIQHALGELSRSVSRGDDRQGDLARIEQIRSELAFLAGAQAPTEEREQRPAIALVG